jgi:potassium efflux system protein
MKVRYAPGGRCSMVRRIWSVRLCAVLAGLAAALILPASGYGQGLFGQGQPTQAAPQPRDTAAAAPQAIPVAEIPLRSRTATARLQAIDTQLSFDPDLALIEEELPGEQAAISRAHERLGRMVLEELSSRELGALESVWQSHEDRLAGWLRTFEDELQELQDASEATREIRDRWQLTLDSLDDEDVAEAVAEQTRRVLDSAVSLRRTQREQLEYVLGVKSQVDDTLEGVRRVLRELATARASVRGRTFSRTAPPIWSVRSIPEQSASGTAARAWSDEWLSFTAFVSDNSSRVLLNVVLFLLFALLAVRLRDRFEVELDAADESLTGASETLHRPFSAALLVALFLANGLYPRAPILALQLFAIAGIVPLYRLLPRSRSARVNSTMRALLVLFGVASLADLLVPPSFEYRLLNLGLALALAIGAGWLLRGGDVDQGHETGWGLVVWRSLKGVLGVGVAAAAANVLGFTMLSERLVTGVLYTAYFSLAVVIGYRVLAGVIRLLPRTAVGQASHIMREHGDVVTSRAITVLKVAALLTGVMLALESFEIGGVIRAWASGVLTGPIRIGALEFSLEKVVSFAVVILLAIWIARLVRFVLDVEILPRLKLKRGASNAISTVAQWTILGAGLVTAASALGLQAGQLAIVFGALSVGIGFGLQNIVSNFVSGLILIFEQPVKVGDKVEITSLALVGEVRRIGVRASIVRTFDGAEVIVPNGNLISSEVVNWTLSDQRRRVRVEVGVAYGTDPHRTMEILKAVAIEHREVLKYPEPSVVFLEFGDSSLNFRLMFWTATFDEFFRIRSEVYVAVHDALKEAGITIPFPQRDLHLKSLPHESSVALNVFSDARAASPAEVDQPKGTAEEEA